MDKNDDAKWFGKAIRTLLTVTGRWKTIPRSEIRPYWDVVEQYAPDVVRAAIGAITRTFTTTATPAHLLQAVNDELARVRRETEYADNRTSKPVDPRGLEFSKMKGAAAPMFLRRLLKQPTPLLDKLNILGGDDYTGAFDFSMVVGAVPIPEGLDLRHTEKVWKQFFEALAYEWDKYQENGAKPA